MCVCACVLSRVICFHPRTDLTLALMDTSDIRKVSVQYVYEGIICSKRYEHQECAVSSIFGNGIDGCLEWFCWTFWTDMLNSSGLQCYNMLSGAVGREGGGRGGEREVKFWLHGLKFILFLVCWSMVWFGVVGKVEVFCNLHETDH